ncbi:MAG: hypothetical protein ABL921_28685 [Pirellula sp.]
MRNYVLACSIGAFLLLSAVCLTLFESDATGNGIVILSSNENQDAAEDSRYFDIGKIHCEVSTRSGKSQRWFDRGLAMCHGFNHEEAVRCFERSIQADPGMAMAYWGLAYAWGPNINNMQVDSGKIGQAASAIQLAKLHSHKCTVWERDVIDAMAKRYTVPVPQERAELNQAYAAAMRSVYAKHDNHPLVVSLFAEALMDLRPWKLWNADGTTAPETPEIVSTIEAGLKRWPDNQQAIEADQAFVKLHGRHNLFTLVPSPQLSFRRLRRDA